MSNVDVSAISFLPVNADIKQLAYSGIDHGQSIQTPFGNWMQQQLSSLNTTLVESDQGAMKLAAGETDNLHLVMIKMEEAKLALQLAMQVKNRLMEAYQDVLRMQV